MGKVKKIQNDQYFRLNLFFSFGNFQKQSVPLPLLRQDVRHEGQRQDAHGEHPRRLPGQLLLITASFRRREADQAQVSLLQPLVQFQPHAQAARREASPPRRHRVLRLLAGPHLEVRPPATHDPGPQREDRSGVSRMPEDVQLEVHSQDAPGVPTREGRPRGSGPGKLQQELTEARKLLCVEPQKVQYEDPVAEHYFVL